MGTGPTIPDDPSRDPAREPDLSLTPATDEELDQLTTPEAMQAGVPSARAAWREDAPRAFKPLLDATPTDGVADDRPSE